MLEKFQQHIEKYRLFLQNKKLLVATSGGIDSVVLVHLLHKLNYTISLAHCNFQLRGEASNLDEEFVKKSAELLNLKAFVTRFNTKEYAEKHKQSIQVSARNLRYNWFDELLKKHQLDYVLTAHHADDNLETFLINLSRGTGLDGLTGIPLQNGKIIRPLLPFSRAEIEQYALENNISWREDETNAETKYLRNKIRHDIVPKLKELHPTFLDNFSKTIDFLKGSQQIIDDKIFEVSSEIILKKDEVIQFDIEKFLKLSNSKVYLYHLLKPYGVTEWNDAYALLSAQSGKKIQTKSHILLKNRGFLLISQIRKQNKERDFFVINEDDFEIIKPIHLKVKKTQYNEVSQNSIQIDKSSVVFPLILRKWQVGDVFYPTKMTGKKKLSKYFKDEKLSQFDKENVWLLCSEEKIIWVVGMRQDRRFLPQTNKNTLTISLS